MKRLLTSVALVALGLAVPGSAQAAGKGSSHNSGSNGSGTHHPNMSVSYHGPTSRGSGNWSPGKSGSYFTSHARKFEHGYYYSGRYHNHWSYHCWDWRYGCRLYYDPGLCCYFYYCVPDNCYYPVTYCPYHRYAWSAPVSGPAP
jgi:hypothetical protein